MVPCLQTYYWNSSSCTSQTSLQWAGSTQASVKVRWETLCRIWKRVLTFFHWIPLSNTTEQESMQNVSNACTCGKTPAEFCKLLHLKPVCCCEMGEGWNGAASEQVTIYNNQIASSIPVPQKHFQTRQHHHLNRSISIIKSMMQTYRFVCNAAVSGRLPQLLPACAYCGFH